MTSASEANRGFYEQALPGRNDYWRKMAAPRARVEQVLALIDELAPSRVVDLGSGGGQLLAEIHARHPETELAGIDISTTQLAENARRLPRVGWHALDLDAGPQLPPGLRRAFDLVIACEIIEHLDHAETFLRTARDLVIPETGRLVLSTQSGPLRETERRVGHRRHWTRGEMAEALARTGWEPERVWNCGFPFHDLSKWYANRDPAGSMDRFASRPYGLAENLICLALRTAFRANSRTRGAQLFAVARRASD